MRSIWKPWYVYRPQQLVRRAAGFFHDPESRHVPLATAWGLTVLANPAEHIGRCLQTTGIYDLSVSEILFRLIRPGDLVIDAGANLGYMALLAAVAATERGSVIAFEPNPDMWPLLEKNIAAARARVRMAPVEIHRTALGARRHQSTLVMPDPAARNDGLGHIGSARDVPAGRRVAEVTVETLDDVLASRHAGLVKIDVEGYEHEVLEGVRGALNARRIRHIVFEDHRGTSSDAAQLLKTAGYELFTIGWSLRRLILDARPGRSAATYYEAPSYLATLDPEEAMRACHRSGWQSLRKQTRLLRSH